MRFSVIVLAAGNSSRLGRPKQLLPYAGSTLLRHAVDTAWAAGPTQVLVVLGSEAERMRSALDGSEAQLVDNERWAEGMGSSISAGMSSVNEGAEVVIVMLCDQPAVTPNHLHELATSCAPGLAAASLYDGVLGVPCAFPRDAFDRLLQLQGHEGARFLIRSGHYQVKAVSLPGGGDDLDTDADIQGLPKQ